MIQKNHLPLDSGNEYSIEEATKLIDSNLQHQTYKVNFTGGDPLIQHQAVAELAKHIQSKKFLHILNLHALILIDSIMFYRLLIL